MSNEFSLVNFIGTTLPAAVQYTSRPAFPDSLTVSSSANASTSTWNITVWSTWCSAREFSGSDGLLSTAAQPEQPIHVRRWQPLIPRSPQRPAVWPGPGSTSSGRENCRHWASAPAWWLAWSEWLPLRALWLRGPPSSSGSSLRWSAMVGAESRNTLALTTLSTPSVCMGLVAFWGTFWRVSSHRNGWENWTARASMEAGWSGTGFRWDIKWAGRLRL